MAIDSKFSPAGLQKENLLYWTTEPVDGSALPDPAVMVNIFFFVHLAFNAFILMFGIGAFLHEEFYSALLAIIAGGLDFISLAPYIKDSSKILPASTFGSHLNLKNILKGMRWLLGFIFVIASASMVMHDQLGLTIEAAPLYIMGAFLLSPLDGIVFDGFEYKPEGDGGLSRDDKTLISLARCAGFFLALIGLALYSDRGTAGELDPTQDVDINLFMLVSIPLLLLGSVVKLIAEKHKRKTVAALQFYNLIAQVEFSKVESPKVESPRVEPTIVQATPLHPKKEARSQQETTRPSPSLNMEELKRDFMELSVLEPQKRGYAFQYFLNKLFNMHDFSSRTAFRIRGEEIDGSFEIESQIYLLEAKWQARPSGQADLLIFNGKVEGKSTWARGIFISYAGFSEDGLHAFALGKRTSIIGMDGQDILHILDGKISLINAIRGKARRAVETNSFFVPILEITR